MYPLPEKLNKGELVAFLLSSVLFYHNSLLCFQRALHKVGTAYVMPEPIFFFTGKGNYSWRRVQRSGVRRTSWEH